MAEDPQKKEILAPPKMTILSDHPILREEDKKKELDAFTLSSRLGAVYDIIRHKNTRPPLAVAIYGDWGTGKSSAMRWLSDALEQWSEQDEDERKGHARVRTVWFDPWKYTKREDVWRGLISEVILESLPREGAPFKRVLRAVRNFGHSLGRAFIDTVGSIELTGGVEGNIGVGQVSGEAKFDLAAFSKILDDYRERSQPEKAYLNEFETALQDWVEDSLEEDERMVLFIDDLDRCLPGVVLEVLEALKLYLNIPQLIFVVGLDRDVVESVVEKHYAEQGLGKAKAKHYLDKMFQVEVEIPPSQTLMSGYIAGQIEAMDAASEKYWSKSLEGWKAEYKTIIEEKITDLAAHNPREVKRLLNSTLLRATAAARDGNLGGTEAERFTQGCQVYLIHCFMKEYVPNSGGLLREERILDFLEAWSDFVQMHSASPSRDGRDGGQMQILVQETNLFGSSLRVLDGAGGGSVRESLRRRRRSENDVAATEYEKLKAAVPCYRGGKAETIPLLGLEDLWDLLTIPFSCAVAAAAVVNVSDPDAAMESKDRGAEGQEATDESASASSVEAAQVSHSLGEGGKPVPATISVSPADLPAFLRSAIARELGKSVDSLRPEDLPRVRSLELNDSGLLDLSPLSQLAGLESLDLMGTAVESIEPLSRLTSLRTLILAFLPIRGVFPLKELVSLRTLSLWATDVADLSPLSDLQRLRLLDLESTKVSDISPLSSLVVLEDLNLSNTPIRSISRLSGLQALRRLSLGNTRVADLSPLAALRSLQNLYLSKTPVVDVARLAPLSSLRELYLSDTQVKDVSPLADLVSLEVLSLPCERVADLSPLSSLKQLRCLDLRCCPWFTDEDLEHFRDCGNLHDLRTQGTRITDGARLAFLDSRDPEPGPEGY